MKKIIYTLSVIAASVCALTSCQKEQDIQNELASNKKVTLSFIAEKAGIETRTAAVEGETSVSYVWTDDDITNFKLFSVTENGNKEVPNLTVNKESETRLTISTEVDANATYTFRAVLSGDWTNNGDKPRVKTTQVPNGTENFDPTADILVSEDFEVEVGEEAEGGARLLTFSRQIVVNKMTLKNLTPGEKVKKVTVKSDKHLTGYLDNGKMSGQQKELSLSYNNEVVPEGGEFDVYFVTMANTDQTLTIDVTTDQYSYSKTFAKTIDFNLGQFTKFGVVLPAGEQVVDFVEGDYFITGVGDDGKYYAAQAYVSGNNIKALSINLNIDEETIEYQNDIKNCVFTFKKVSDVEGHEGEFTIQDANGLYLYAAGGSGSNNYLKGEAAPDNNGNAYWIVSKNTDGTYLVQSNGNAARNQMRFNYNYNNTTGVAAPLFSCYASGQKAITLYPAEWCDMSGDEPGEDPGIKTEHEGTAEDPFSVADAKAYIDGNGTEKAYVKGIISEIKYTFDVEHGTATFWISEDGQSNDFQAYSIYYLENKRWQEDYSQIKLGDEVILYGTPIKYDSIYEMAGNGGKDAYIYSLNGVTTIEGGNTDPGTEPEQPGDEEFYAIFNYPDLYSTVTSTSINLDGKSDTVDGVTIAYAKVSGSNAPQYYLNGTNLRIYNLSTMTVTAPEGKVITGIDFSQGTTTWVSGKMVGDTGVVDDNNKKWTNKDGVEKVILTISGSFRFTMIKVAYN